MITLDVKERVVQVVRKHWFVLLREMLGVGFVFLLPFILYGFVEAYGFITLSSRVLGFLGLAWFIVCWMKAYGYFTDYYLDLWTLTDRRIVAIDQRGFFNRATSSLRLERIQDITVEIKGVIETVLDFGTMRVQTAGEEPDFVIRGIPHPKQFKELIIAHYDPKIEQHRPNIAGTM